MREMVEQAEPNTGKQDLRIDEAGAKIENLDARGGADPHTIRAIYDQTREVRDLLARAANAALPGERAQRELADIAERIEHGPAGLGRFREFAQVRKHANFGP